MKFTADKKIILSLPANAGLIVLLKQQGKVLLQKISLARKRKTQPNRSVPNGIDWAGWTLRHPDYSLVPGEGAAVPVSRHTGSSLAIIARVWSNHRGKGHYKKQNKIIVPPGDWQCHHQHGDKGQQEITLSLRNKLFSINTKAIANASHHTAKSHRAFIHSHHYLINGKNNESDTASINNQRHVNATLRNERSIYCRALAERHAIKYPANIHDIKNIVGYLPIGVSPHYIKGNK